MGTDLYAVLRDAYNFEAFNRDRGVEITSEIDPQASYHLPNGEINFYSYSPDLRDLLHPFRPSGTVIAEIPVDMAGAEIEMYLSGTEEQFEELDEKLMNIIERIESGEYFKKIC